MDANLVEVGSKLLAKGIAEEDIQWSTEMTYPVHFHHSCQHNLLFRRIIRKVVKADLSNWTQGTLARILDAPRGVGTYLRGDKVIPPRRVKEKKEDGVVRSLTKNTPQFLKQSLVRCLSRILRRVVGEGVG